MSFSDWPNQPNLLIGQQVEVELTSGKSLGIVSAYNSSTKQFTILFGKDEKQLDFFAVTFKIVNYIFYVLKLC